MSDLNEQYQAALDTVDMLLKRKDYRSAQRALEHLYQFKPVRLTWFVRKAKLVWLTKGAEDAKQVLKDKFTLNYCYEGIPEALDLLAEIEGRQGHLLEQERLQCSLDWALQYGLPKAIYSELQTELEVCGKAFWETGMLEQAKAFWKSSYVTSDAIKAMVVEYYLRQNDVSVPDLPWATELPNIQYIRERIEESQGNFIILSEEENQNQAFALARMLKEIGKQVYLLLPPVDYSGTSNEFFIESGTHSIHTARDWAGIMVIDTYAIQQDDLMFDNRYLILESLIEKEGTLFTVLGSGSLMDDVAMAGSMKKHFERFNLGMGDMLDSNFSAGWVGDHLKYLENIYDMDVKACLDAPATCSYSIVVPARNSASTLRYTLQTCLDQNFPADQYEIIVSDNSTNQNSDVYELCQELNDPRIRYIKTPRELVLGRSFEFAFLKARGAFILSLGSDDGLLPWALHTLDQIRKQYPKENIIQWERGFYAWPGFNGNQQNQLIIPRDYKKVVQPIFYVSTEYYLKNVNNNPSNIYILPLLYINSGFRREYRKVLLEKTGRMWDGGAQDIYTGFVNVLINSRILNICWPLSIAGMSSTSVGALMSKNRGNPDNQKAVASVSKGTAISTWSPSMPEKLAAAGSSDAAIVTRFLYRCVARGLLAFEKVAEILNLKAFFIQAANGCNPLYEQSEANLRLLLYTASMYGEDFYQWCDENVFTPMMIPRMLTPGEVPKYQEGRSENGGEMLDASRYGVKNIAQAVHLFSERSGLIETENLR